MQLRGVEFGRAGGKWTPVGGTFENKTVFGEMREALEICEETSYITLLTHEGLDFRRRFVAWMEDAQESREGQ